MVWWNLLLLLFKHFCCSSIFQGPVQAPVLTLLWSLNSWLGFFMPSFRQRDVPWIILLFVCFNSESAAQALHHKAAPRTARAAAEPETGSRSAPINEVMRGRTVKWCSNYLNSCRSSLRKVYCNMYVVSELSIAAKSWWINKGLKLQCNYSPLNTIHSRGGMLERRGGEYTFKMHLR